MPEAPRTIQKRDRKDAQQSEFLGSLKKGMLIGAAVLLLVIPALRMAKQQVAPPQPPVATTQQQPAPQAGQETPSERPAAKPQPDTASAPLPVVRLADFNGEQPSEDAGMVANWAVATRDHQKHAFVIIDKKDARVYVFSPEGKLKDSAPALLGEARGDDSFPGIGDKPLSAVRPEEKTTPAGRFVAEPGKNTNNEDIIWVDYDAAVSMHRIRPMVARERRLERLATLTTDDNRISFGCVNLPVTFYENVLSPTVHQQGAIVYVLPETKSPRQLFGAYDVTDPIQVAAAQHERRHQEASAREATQKVALQPR
ncbi:MAG TPA: hypothetical protein VFB71_04910 [Ramlibacter sp.]|nr:hypothetical protein [Ramlibacter sp.]